MTREEAEKFYKQNKQKYNISKNKELLSWLKKHIKSGYHSFIDLEDLQELIDNIADWYEIKYPEREIDTFEGITYFNFENIRSLSNVMDTNQLMYRLLENQLWLMECDYRSSGAGIRHIYNDKNQIIGHKPILFMQIGQKGFQHNALASFVKLPSFLLRAYSETGEVDIDNNIKKYVKNDNITLDELLVLLKRKYSDILDISELEECIYDHKCDTILRNKILQLVALKLLYSGKTTPERGYCRAKCFINEFNKNLGLNLDTKEIDEAITKDYTNKNTTLEKVKNLSKTIFKK